MVKEEDMKTKQLLDIIQTKTVQIPLYLYRERKELGLDTETFVFLMYLVSEGEKFRFNPSKIVEDLDMDLETVMQNIETLSEQHYICVDVEKNSQGIMEEFVSLESFWKKILKLLIREMNQEVEVDATTIYDRIQQEFGRTLSPIEYEIIGAWVDSNIPEELIHEAVKEAVFNGVNNLRYIDKILYEWGKKGYKTKADVEAQREKWKEAKTSEKKVKKEVFDYNWLEEDENEE